MDHHPAADASARNTPVPNAPAPTVPAPPTPTPAPPASTPAPPAPVPAAAAGMTAPMIPDPPPVPPPGPIPAATHAPVMTPQQLWEAYEALPPMPVPIRGRHRAQPPALDTSHYTLQQLKEAYAAIPDSRPLRRRGHTNVSSAPQHHGQYQQDLNHAPRLIITFVEPPQMAPIPGITAVGPAVGPLYLAPPQPTEAHTVVPDLPPLQPGQY